MSSTVHQRCSQLYEMELQQSGASSSRLMLNAVSRSNTRVSVAGQATSVDAKIASTCT